MNFPPLWNLLWKIHFMLVYSSKIHDWTVTKQETWLRECEKSPYMHKPVGILESPLPLTFGLPVILDSGLLLAEGALWLLLCPVTGKWSQNKCYILWNTEEYLLGWGRAVGCPDLRFCIHQHLRRSLGTYLVTSNLFESRNFWFFFLLWECACINYLIAANVALKLMWQNIPLSSITGF